jgi:hypothetical protein
MVSNKARSALLALLLPFSGIAAATTFSTDASDLWYNSPAESESGWGVNVVQQADTLFMTMFVYGANSLPAWYVASEVAYTGATTLIFSGPLYTTGGSPYAAPWNPAAFNFRQVGTVTFTLTSVTTAVLSYTVDGATVTKNLVRETWKYENTSGNYMGGQVGTYSSCANAANNGYREEAGPVSIAHNGPDWAMQAPLSGGTGTGACNYSGSYVQHGRMGSVSGTFACTGGITGMFNALEVEANLTGITARVVAQSNSCSWVGRVGGLRRTP